MFEQYDISDIEMAFDVGDLWTGSIYDPGMISSDWVSEWVAQYQPTSLVSASAGSVPSASGGGTGILQSILSAGTSVAAALLGKQATQTTAAKTTATPYYNPTTGQYQSTPYVAGTTSILSSLTSSLPLLGIVGIGAYFLLKKRGKK